MAAGGRPVSLYLDTSDLSTLAFARPRTPNARERNRLAALAKSGSLQLRVSVAHFVEATRLSWRRLGPLFRLMLRDLPNTVLARRLPGLIVEAERSGAAVDLDDVPTQCLAWREILRLSLVAGVLGPYSENLALSKNQMKSLIRFLRAKSPRNSRVSPACAAVAPAQALAQVLDAGLDRNLHRNARRSDFLDRIHVMYAAYSDVASVDAYVYDTTKAVRRHLRASTSWYRTGRVREILDAIEAMHLQGEPSTTPG